VLGDVEETIYAVEDDDEDDEVVKVRDKANSHCITGLTTSTDYQEAVGDAVR